MTVPSKPKEDRTYDVRIVSQQKVRKALKIEQNNRHKAADYSGSEPRLVDILADWVEEKADQVLGSDSEG